MCGAFEIILQPHSWDPPCQQKGRWGLEMRPAKWVTQLPKSARVCTGSSTREMRELRPASVMQKKKMAQRNRPALMVANKIGILGRKKS